MRFELPHLLSIAALTLAGAAATPAKAEPSNLAGAGFRIVNLSPGSPPQDFCANRELFQASVPFGDARNYRPLRAGEISSLDRLAEGDGCDGPVSNNTPFMLPPGGFISAVAIRRFEQISAIILRDDNSPPAPGTVRLRFVNAVVDSGTLDLSTDAGATLFAGVAEETSGGYISLPPGTLRLSTQQPGGSAAAQADAELIEGGVYTVFAAGIAGGDPGARLLVVQDNADLPSTLLCNDLTIDAVALRDGRIQDFLWVEGSLAGDVALDQPGSLQVGARTVSFSRLRRILGGRAFALIARKLSFFAVSGDTEREFVATRRGRVTPTNDPNGQLTLRYRTDGTDATCIVRLTDGALAP